MTLITSISGIRGTLGGRPGACLTPIDAVRFASAYGMWIRKSSDLEDIRVVLGRDARPSGPMISNLVASALNGMGIHVTDLGLATTPTVEMAVPEEKAVGGIIITASHNPVEWNALKLLNSRGEFLSAADGKEVLRIAETEEIDFVAVEHIGRYTEADYNEYHIERILELELVDVAAIRKAGFKVAVDAVNSVGGLILPELLERLGVKEVVELFTDPTGFFPHNPEPLPENVADIAALVQEKNADVGFVVDPDVDRLAIVNEDGSLFGEEYTLVSVAAYVLDHTPGPAVSNLSSTRALRDICTARELDYFSAAVGEVNVVRKMREVNAVIGGEGNGGVIYPPLHYGRDALAGIALFLTQLARFRGTCSELRQTLPEYTISKNRIELEDGTDVEKILLQVRKQYAHYPISLEDGVKIDFKDGWIHLRKSNTEPIIRVYTEGRDRESAEALASEVMEFIRGME